MVTLSNTSARWEKPAAAGFILPLGIVGALTLMAPLCANLYFALFAGRLAEPFARFVGLANYHELVTDPNARAALVRGAWYAFTSSTAQVLLALAAASWVNPCGSVARWLRRGALVPVLVPPAAYVAVFKMSFDATYGPAAMFLSSLAGRPVAVLTESSLLPVAVVLTTLQFFPLSFLLFLERLQRVPLAIERQAAVDGLGPWQRFVTVLLPAVAPLFFALWVLRFFLTFGKFDVLYFLAGTSASYRAVETPPLYIFREALSQGRLAYGAAACGLLLLAGSVAVICYFTVTAALRARGTDLFWRAVTLRRRATAAETRWQHVAGYTLGGTAIMLLGVSMFLPIATMLIGSMTVGFPTRFGGFTVDHYLALAQQFRFASPFLNSVVVTASVLAITLCTGLPLAFFISSFRAPALRQLGAIGLAAYCVPAILLVFGTLLLVGHWHMSGTYVAVVLGLVGFCLPLTCVTLVSFGDDEPSLGAVRGSADRIPLHVYFFRVFLANRRGALGAAAVLCFAACWSDYLFAATLGGSQVRTAVVAFQDIYSGAVIPWGALMAAAVTISLPTVCAGLFVDHVLAKRKVVHE